MESKCLPGTSLCTKKTKRNLPTKKLEVKMVSAISKKLIHPFHFSSLYLKKKLMFEIGYLSLSKKKVSRCISAILI